MDKRTLLFAAGALVALGVSMSCSKDEEGASGGSGGSGASGNSGGTAGFRDIDGDGVLDPLTPGDFGEAAVPITEEELEAMRNASCAGWSAAPEPLDSSLFFVVDASSSMRATAAGTGDRSKWEVTRDAMVEVLDLLPDQEAVGLLGYPNQEVTGHDERSDCVNVDALIPLGLLGANEHRQVLIDGMNAIETMTCTPTRDAYMAALESVVASALPGQKYILLMTDGTPTLALNCEYDGTGDCGSSVSDGEQEAIIAAIGAAYQDAYVKTFVLGSPGSEEHMDTGLDNRGWLSRAAEAGGTALGGCSHEQEPYCHFDMTTSSDFGAALRDALATIAGSVVSCDYSLPAPPDGETLDTGAINLVLRPDGAAPIQILRVTDPDCEQGWYYGETQQHVMLCSQTCALAQSDPNIELELMFGCASDTVIPE